MSRITRFIIVLAAILTLTRSVAAQVLPPVQLPPAETNKLSAAAALFVVGYAFDGNTVFTDEELSAVTAPYSNRAITSGDLEDSRRAVTMHYISHGYVNSGAIIPDQDPGNGIIRMTIVEGTLGAVHVRGNRWLRDRFITAHVRRHAGPPLNMNELKDGLLELRQNPNVTQVNAEIKPGASPGEGVLDLQVLDQHPFRLGLQVDNHRPPSVGAEQITLLASDLNVTGHNDVLDLSYGIANSGADDGWGFSGWDNVAGSYTVPVTSANTTVSFFGSRDDTAIIEEPFASLVIDSETVSYGVVIRHPLYQTANRELALAVGFDRRQNDTTLLGLPWPVSPGADLNGRTTVSALRFSQEWIDRRQDQVLALRSTFNCGLDVLDATDDGIPDNPDGTFFSWVGQAQYVRRLFNTQNQVILRLTGQWTDQRLVGLEQISVGGSETVRGYRENEFVRDRGIVSSVEFRVPVWFDKTGAGIVQLAPFFDIGGAWNVDGPDTQNTISSVGIGLLITPNKHLDAQLYWGHRLHSVPSPDNDPQDLGLHFLVRVSAF